MPSLLNHLKRLRCSRGFGVHSPFAFRFITEVLHGSCAYYCYSRIQDPRQRLLFRVVLDLHPACVALLPGAEDMGDAVRAAWSSVPFTQADEAEMVVGHMCHDMETYAAAGKHLVILGDIRPESWKAVKAAMPYGMTFKNVRGMAIAVSHKHLPRQDFELLF